MSREPESMAEAVRGVRSNDEFGYAVRNFLDDFYRTPTPELLAEEPARLAETLDDDGVADAWLAAAATHLCQLKGFRFPGWIKGDDRIARKPWFAAESPKMRLVLLQESPAAFRARNLFVSANALSRA